MEHPASSNSKSRFDFSRLLGRQARELLPETRHWRWIANIGDRAVPEIRHPRHERWLKVKGHCHAPAHREVMLTYAGSAVHSLTGKIYQRHPGTVILFDHYEIRDLKGAPHKTGFHCLWLHFQSHELLTYNSNSCDAKGRYYQEIPTRIKSGEQVRLIMEAWDQCKALPDDKLCWELLKTKLTGILLEIMGTAEPARPEHHHRQVIESIENYIHRHLGDDLGLHCLARIGGYSPFFFHRLFARYTGKTPVEYVNAARLDRAKELLKLNYTVQAVAEHVGFNSTSYFSHFFKKRMGFSPRAWSELEAG